MKNGGGWEDAIHIVAEDIQKLLKKTIVVKTPKQGCHIILQPIGDLPPKNSKYLSNRFKNTMNFFVVISSNKFSTSKTSFFDNSWSLMA